MTSTVGGGSQGPEYNQDKKEFRLFLLRDRLLNAEGLTDLESRILWRMAMLHPKPHFETSKTLAAFLKRYHFNSIKRTRRRLVQMGLIDECGKTNTNVKYYKLTEKALKLAGETVMEDEAFDRPVFLGRLIEQCEKSSW
jgi:hypothetical protein